jgi:serine phosphatase RsbU (regulator of sigma subunit)/HAMP domain-containing protein
MGVRMTIGRKIGLGFGLFIFFALVVVVLTNATLERSRQINEQINQVYSPSVDALARLRNLTTNAHMLIKHWALMESRADAPEKSALITLTEEELPRLLDRVDTLMGHWGPEEVALMEEVIVEMDGLLTLHQRIRQMLPSLESYSDPILHMERTEMAEEGGILDRQNEAVLGGLDRLLDLLEEKRRHLSGSMIRSFNSLRFFVLYLGLALVVVGTVLAGVIVRGIVRPLQRLRSVVIDLGRGVFPRQQIQITNDEVGDMGKALTGLVDGLRRTTEFSHGVAAGDFSAQYVPLSDEDVLGHALLKMRDELGERERVLESKVAKRTEEVLRQKEEVERQSRRIEELYNNVTDSIRYAKRLQGSILPPAERFRELLPQSFVFFAPRDIVSGDFYWLEKAGDRVLFAAVDCTGHGVPGAFMSLVAHNSLNQAVKEYGHASPARILKELDRIAFSTLHRDRTEGGIRDGMDMALCAYHPATLMLEYAGANAPMYVVRQGEVLIYTPNKNTIGSFAMDGGEIQGHQVQLQAGDMVYLFSDGYADQFGGPKGKKFLYRRFRELLVSIADLPMEEQHDKLRGTFRAWRQGHEQVDDILVIGMRA